MSMQKARLEQWFVGEGDFLYGLSYSHPKHEDGTPIRTSRVVIWDRKIGKAVTKNTEYELGEPGIPWEERDEVYRHEAR